ncbi:uncharacterized protein LOC132738766 [Ruditapes philippinarum]|uniref:uncharacterized protein LOC132738766 n=1 Tax=Ruditapes philippinarum TaxID=129788 RepID=UPI00295B991D|nr:uncharacterized protein LOC132738766 [Ruditapes philippinarum]
MANGDNININFLSNETIDKVCNICKRKDKISEAEKFCIDCQENHCLKCVKVHEDVPLLGNHEILDKDQFQSCSSAYIPMSPTDQCERHTHKHVDMYCENHDVVGCSTCMAVDHRSCQGRFYISEYITNDVTIDPIEEELKSCEKTLDENQTFFQRNKERLLKEKSSLLEDIKGLREKINTRLDKLEKKILREVNNVFTGLIEEAEKLFNLLQPCKESVKAGLHKLQSPSPSVQQTFVNYKRGIQIANYVDQQLGNISTQKQNITVDFIPDKRMQVLLEEIKCFGQVKQHYSKNSLLEIKGKVEKSITDRSKCNIVSACVAGDGSIILSDRSNRNLKRLDDSTFAVSEVYQLSGCPWQVCTIRQRKVAVCLTDIKTVEFVSIGNKMSTSNDIKTDFMCFALAYSCGYLYISDSNTSVYVYNLSGIKLKQFSMDSSGNNLFSDIRILAVNRSRIYVTDSWKGLVILDTNGSSTGKVDGPKLKSAYGGSLTADGSLLVYDNGSGILQYGENGKFVGKIPKPSHTYKNTVWGQITICCNKQMTKLILAGTSDKIEVYRISYGKEK